MVLLILSFAQALYATGVKNLAVLNLYPLWQQRATQIFDPPCYTDGRFPEIERQLQPAVILGDARALTHLGRMQWLEGHCTEAIEAWKRAWTTTGDPAAALELVRVGEYATLSPDIRRVIAEGFYQRGLKLVEAKNDQMARLWFKSSFELVPQRKSAEMLAYQEGRVGNNAQIIATWRRLADSSLEIEADHWWALGRLYGSDDQWEQAALMYERGVELTDTPIDFLIEAGRSWEYARKWAQAESAYMQAYQRKPDSVKAQLGLGNVARAKGHYQDALNWYLRAEQIQPKDLLVQLYLGIVYYQIKDYGLAREHLEKTLALSPEYAIGMYYLALVAYAEGNCLLAEEKLASAIRYNHQAPVSWWIQLGDWRAELQNCLGAREAYASASKAGASDLLVQQKVNALNKVCQSQE